MNLNFPLAPTVPRTTTSSRPKMRRQREGMQVNVAGLRRNIMNLAHNYSGAQVKVREATSNDPWGPSSTLMSEIADLTYNVVAFTEIMQMVWKRLNDHGRNWRHVYKALVLLDYLIKTGSEKVAQQCKENIFAIQTLRDFQYVEEGKDQGINVREKAKQLVLLLKDDERLRNERARALKAKERFAQTASGFGSDTGLDTVSPSSPGFPSYRDAWGSCEDATPTSRSGGAGGAPELESARPQTVGEEELQLQLALAMSREEAQQEEQKRRSDDVRLQLALSQSENEFKQKHVPKDADMPSSHMLDLLDVNLGAASPPQPTLDPWGMPASQPPPPRPQTDPWSVTTASSTPSVSDPWTPASTSAQPLPPKPDPWRAVSSLPEPPTPVPPKPPMNDPWSPASPALSVSPPPPHSGANNGYSCAANAASTPLSDLDEFDQILNRDRNINSVNNNLTGTISPDPFDLSGLSNSLTPSPSNVPPPKKTPQSFLGENSSLVNLENLVTKTSLTSVPAVPAPPALANPFSNSPTLVRPPLRTPPYPPAVQAPLLPQPNPFLS